MIHILYKYRDRQLLIVTGHFNAKEIRLLRREGYSFKNPKNNKHGIEVVQCKG